jgi:uncharacterized integral membrane protein
MRFFFGLAFLVLVGVSIFAIQNSTAPPVDMKFVVWDLRTSLVYTVLGVFASGMVVILLLWIPSALRAASQKRSLRKEIEILRRERKLDAEASEQRARSSEKEGISEP